MKQALLIEIGCEEIPAGLALPLAEALRLRLEQTLQQAHIDVGSMHIGVTPRRLMVHALNCPVIQQDRQEDIWGPPERIAFPDGKASKAAEGFARKQGMDLQSFSLKDKGDGKGCYMHSRRLIQGKSVSDILARELPNIIRKLPCGKEMRWQDGTCRDEGFIRPIRWIVARLGEEPIPFQYAGVASGTKSRGHRILGKASISLDPSHPFEQLKLQYVMADRQARRQWIISQLELAASRECVRLIEDPALLDEVTDLTEWPQVISGHYDDAFLRLPSEVSRVELKHHQRCFATECEDGTVSPIFFAVANIESKDPQRVSEGNARVVNARLADAAFYFDRDPQHSLEKRVEMLNRVVFQEGLGMLSDQVQRLRGFVLDHAQAFAADANIAQRAAYLCKSDLTTGLVAEFPELQGYMGGIYADIDGESMPIAMAIAEHYKPIHADDALPSSIAARCIGVAERMDKLLGYFHLGRIPTASADPFGLRRACIGMIRLLSDQEYRVELTISEIIQQSAKQWNEQRVTIAIGEDTRQQVLNFIHERLLGMAAGFGVSRNALEAALGAAIERPLYAVIELALLLDGFANTSEGQAIAAANKRVANIMRKNKITDRQAIDIQSHMFRDHAEDRLYHALLETEQKCLHADFTTILQHLASLHETVDSFFNDVMVMAEDEDLRKNRLALLTRLRQLFLQLADVSKL